MRTTQKTIVIIETKQEMLDIIAKGIGLQPGDVLSDCCATGEPHWANLELRAGVELPLQPRE